MPPPAEGSSRRSVSIAAEPQPEPWAQNQTRGPVHDSTLQEASEAGLFLGKGFLLVGFGSESEAQLSLLVTENGGRVLMGRTRVVADYAVVPLLGCSVEATVDEVVTDTWLVRSHLYCFKIFVRREEGEAYMVISGSSVDLSGGRTKGQIHELIILLTKSFFVFLVYMINN